MEKFKGVMKTKRKELEDVNDDFFDFSLSSPARKIRRLDIELPPIVEEEIDHSMGYEQVKPETAMSNGGGNPLEMPDIEELPTSVPANEEKAIVLFKPVNTYSMSNFTVDPNLISSFKNQALWGLNINASGQINEDDYVKGDNGEVNSCRAVIPWVPSLKLNSEPELSGSQLEMMSSESMDAEEPDVITMDFEDAGASVAGQHMSEFSHLSRINEGLPHQWQQQHCMFPQPPQNPSCVVPVVDNRYV